MQSAASGRRPGECAPVSGKGSAPRPFAVTQDEYASNWDRIFRGVPERSKGDGSNPSTAVGSNPTPAAIYVDNESGSVVPETWWPGDPAPTTLEN